VNLIDRIIALSKEKGIKQSYLNNLIGAYRGKITDCKNGKSTLSNNEVSIIANALNVTTDYLLNGSDAKKSPTKENDEVPEEFLVMARKAGDISPEQRKRLYKFLDSTIDNFLEALNHEEPNK
jgi:transcriptional regulator with XRE-family HTH domain